MKFKHRAMSKALKIWAQVERAWNDEQRLENWEKIDFTVR